MKGDFIFCPKTAEKYGVEQAVLIRHLQYWISKNAANEVNFIDGRYWTYNSVRAFARLFTFWNAKKIERLLGSLIENDVLITGQFNKMKNDRTLWYSFKCQSEFLEPKLLEYNIPRKKEIDFPDLSNGFPNSVEPLPDSKPNDKPYLKGKYKNASRCYKKSESKFDQIAQGVYQQINNRQQD